MGEARFAVTDLSSFRRDHEGPGRGVEPRTAASAVELPSGTVTFLLTDIERSTRVCEARPDLMRDAVARHYDILDRVVAEHGGVRPIEQGEGDSLVAAFTGASAAVAAALVAQRALLTEPWPAGIEFELGVRMALHSGEAELRDGRFYTGPSIVRCARLRAMAHGGQVLISSTTADLLAGNLPDTASLLPLGVHRLQDLRESERVFQVAHPALPADFPPLRSLDVLPNNLPRQVSSFVGRAAELAEVDGLVAANRLVTVVGPGGGGKTRLALQVAAGIADRYPEGVWWADFATVTDAAVVPRTVMTALGLFDARGLEPADRVVTYLRDRRALILVDNCEHVLDATADLVERILGSCPEVSIIATSREALRIGGEVAWRIPPLSLPDDLTGPSADLLSSDAVALFAARAGEARPTFSLDVSNLPIVAGICSRLDGIPLAIELAASRIRSLSPARILAALDDRFRLLTGNTRTALPRQRTLEASVEWSHALLTGPERSLLRRLAAFAGSFTLGAAEEVCAGDGIEAWEVLTLLSDLVDRSLVVFDGERYRLLQTIRDFASGRLVDAGEAQSVRDRHAAWFVTQAEAGGAELEQGPRPDLLDRLEADHDNVRGALAWVLERGDHERGLRLVAALATFLTTHGHYSEGQEWHRRALAAAPAEPTLLRARALWGYAHISCWGMDTTCGYGAAEMDEADRLSVMHGDGSLRARILADRAFFQAWLAPEGAEATLEQAFVAARQAEDEWAIGTALWTTAFLWTFAYDRPDRAAPALDELAARAHRDRSPYWSGWADLSRGVAAWHEGRLGDARRALEAAMGAALALGEPKLDLYSATILASVLLAQGDFAAVTATVSAAVDRQRRSLECAENWPEARLALAAVAQGNLAEARRVTAGVGPKYLEYDIPRLTTEYAAIRTCIALAEGDLATARAALGEASDVATSLGNPWATVETCNLNGRLARAEGDLMVAEDHHHRALHVCVEHGFFGAAADTLEYLAALAATKEGHGEATRLFGAAETLRQQTGQRRWPVDVLRYDTDITTLRTALGDDGFAAAWKEGSDLSLDEAAAYASRARGQRKRPSHGWDSLTPTELQVATLAAEGLTNARIGERLFVSPGTAKTHLSSIYAKLGVANRAELATEVTRRRTRSDLQ